MGLGKLENGVLKIAPTQLLINDRLIINPTDGQYKKLGYKMVEYTEQPQTDEMHEAISKWVEEVDRIVQKWIVIKTYRQKNGYEIADMFVRQNIQTLSVTDDEALCMKEYYPTWEEVLKQKTLNKGFKFTYEGELWEVVQKHTPQSIYTPSVNTASLYKHIVENYAGTTEEPIPYKPPMELFKGKIYTDGVELYKCTRDSGQALSHKLGELVGLYVNKM